LIERPSCGGGFLPCTSQIAPPAASSRAAQPSATAPRAIQCRSSSPEMTGMRPRSSPVTRGTVSSPSPWRIWGPGPGGDLRPATGGTRPRSGPWDKDQDHPSGNGETVLLGDPAARIRPSWCLRDSQSFPSLHGSNGERDVAHPGSRADASRTAACGAGVDHHCCHWFQVRRGGARRQYRRAMEVRGGATARAAGFSLPLGGESQRSGEFHRSMQRAGHDGRVTQSIEPVEVPARQALPSRRTCFASRQWILFLLWLWGNGQDGTERVGVVAGRGRCGGRRGSWCPSRRGNRLHPRRGCGR